MYCLLSSFSGPLNYPVVSMESTTQLDHFEPLFRILSKPNAAIVAGRSIQNIKETKKTLLKLQKEIKEIPSFILVIIDKYQKVENLDGIQFESEAPWVLAEEGDPVFTLFCPNTSTVRKMTWRYTDFSGWKNFKRICSENKKHLRVAFNVDMPYMTTDLNVPSIEGMIIKTFVERFGLSVELNNAFGKWGGIDEDTGLWNGVVGMVSSYSH